MKYVIGIDLGSGSIRAAAFDLTGNVASIASRPSRSVAPDANHPDHIVWPHKTVWESTCAVLREVAQTLPGDAEILGVATACLGMDGLPMNQAGEAMYDFIAWTDQRCTPYYEAWGETFGEDKQFLATGTPARGFSTLFRLQWMADNHAEILERTHKWVLMGDFVNFRLCGELAIDYSMAACTLLFDPRTNDWHPEIAAASGVDTSLMCDPHPSGTVLGTITRLAAQETGLPEGTPVILGGHDYLCGVLPLATQSKSSIVNVGGTWDIIQTAVADFNPPTSAAGTGWTVEPHVVPGTYSAFGAAIGGAVTNWFRDEFARELSDDAYFKLSKNAAGQQVNSLLFLPHLAGATGPIIDTSAAGAFLGLRAGHTRQNLLSAIFEGLNFQTKEILDSAANFGVIADRFIFVGGSSKNKSFVQSKADTMGLPVDVPEMAETTLLGAAILAAFGAGHFGSMDEAIHAMKPAMTCTEPDLKRTMLLAERFEIFKEGFVTLNKINRVLTLTGGA